MTIETNDNLEKNVNTEENKTPLTINSSLANEYQTNLKLTKSTGSLTDKKSNQEVQKNFTDNPIINTLNEKLTNYEDQQKESLKNTNSIDFSKSYEEMKLQEKDKQITRLEEWNKKWETNFNKLQERYINLNKRLEKDKEVAKKSGMNEVKWNWEKYISKDDVVEAASEKYNMITSEEAQKLRQRIKELEEKIKQQTNSTDSEKLSGGGWTHEALEKVKNLQSQVDHLSNELTIEKSNNTLLEKKIQNLESSNQREKDRHSKTKERINNLVDTTRNQVKEEYKNFIDPLDKEKVKRTAKRLGMITQEDKEKLEAQISEQTNSTESENSNKNLLGIAKKLNIDEIEVDEDTPMEATQEIVTREINKLQKEANKNWKLSTDITKLNVKISKLERELERKNKENERLNKINTNLQKSLESLQKTVEERNEIEEERVETAKQQGKLEAQGKCLEDKHINPNDEKNENKVKSIAKTKYGMKTKETYDKVVKEKNSLKKELDNLKKQPSETSNAPANSQEQISETKPITGKQINIALVFLAVVSWIGLLGVLIKDRKKPEQSKVRIK